MKKLFRIFLFFFSAIFGLLVLIIIVLNVYYGILDRRFTRLENERKKNPVSIVISPKTISPVQSKSILNLIPVPRKVSYKEGKYSIPAGINFSVEDSLKVEAVKYLKIILSKEANYKASGANFVFRFNNTLPGQGYILDIGNNKVNIEYGSRQGLWYALVSLKILNKNYSGSIPCVTIEDYPDLEVRGLMLDISRDKVPSRETLVQVAQLLSDLKYNHLELYIEGFSFAYPSFKELWEGKETPVTIEDIEFLDAFCKEHFIDLVPNQNSLGHMMAWLATDRYKDLAECPNGYKIFGLINMKGTIDPNNPGSLELVTKMTNDLLPHFTSGSFNVNLDEPFELGKGKSKELVEKVGVGKVYLDYVLKMHNLAAGRGKKMLMWGDIVLKHPEVIKSIPNDITLLDWGYEASYPYEKNCRLLREAGLNYMVCPGTNSWTTITGRTDNMLTTISNAARNGSKFGARGLLMTDWGDMGHWQYLPVSYAGYTVGSALSWNCKSENEMPLSKFLNSYIFCDDKGIMGDLVLDLGRYYRFEEFPMLNMTTTMMALQLGLRDKVMINAIFDKMIEGVTGLMGETAPELVQEFKNQYNNRHSFDYNGLNDYLDSKQILLEKTSLRTADSSLVKDEYINAIRLIRLGSGLKNYVENRNSLSPDEQISTLKGLRELGLKYLEENKRLWLTRNKPGGYDRSTAVLNTLMNQIDKRIELLGKPAPARFYNRLLERTGTAGAVFYIGSN
jgi:hexosaminidase